MKQLTPQNLAKASVVAAALAIALSACSNEKATEQGSHSEAEQQISTPEQKGIKEVKTEVASIVTGKVTEKATELASESGAIIEETKDQVNELKANLSSQLEEPDPVAEVVSTAVEKVDDVSETIAETTDSLSTTIQEDSDVSANVIESTSKVSLEEKADDVSEVVELAVQEVAEPEVELFVPRSGTWTKKSKKILGKWRIEKRGSDAYLILGDDFKTSKAPDLKFVLSNQTVSDVANKNAMQNVLFIADLKSPKGAQEYKLPENFSDYTTLLLHCEKYTKLWGAADIQ